MKVRIDGSAEWITGLQLTLAQAQRIGAAVDVICVSENRHDEHARAMRRYRDTYGPGQVMPADRQIAQAARKGGELCAAHELTPAGDAVARRPSEEEPTAAELMSSPVITISVADTVWHAWTLLYRFGLRHLVVLDGARCVGVIDDRQIALVWPHGPRHDHTCRVGQLVARKTQRALTDTPVSELARIMLRHHADAVPILDATDQVVGVVTARDLLQVLARDRDGRDAGAATSR